MPNPVAANDLQPISGSLQTSRVSYGVETAGKNYGQDYNGTTWYSDIPNNGQFYTIISDNYTANYYVSRSNSEGAYVEGGLPAVDEYSAPVFWVTPGTSSLDIVTIVNGLPDRVGQTPFVSGAEALNWIASSSNYFAVGPDYYEQIDADRLGLYLDANQVISYPTTQSTWYDLSGQSQNFTLYNGVKWQNDGWFEFDLTDDYMLNTTVPYQSSSGTIVVTCYPNSGLDNDYIAGVGGNLTIGGSRAIGIISNRWWFVGYGSTNEDYQSGIPVNYDRWSHVAYTWNNTTEITASANGVFEKVIRTGLVTPNGVNFTLGRPPWNTAANTWGGFLSKVQFYPKALTEAEMRQNYYGGPIVIDNLVYALDAGNLVSYPKTGTAWYTLTGSVDGTLTNGPTFSPINGGYISFDGTNDYVGFGNNILFPGVSLNGTTPELTIDVWVNWDQFCIGGALDEIISWWSSGTQTYLDGFLGTSIISPYSPTNPGIRFGDDWAGTGVTFTAATDVNKWWHIVAVKTSDNAYIYINGELRATKGSALNWGFNNYAYVAAHGGGTTEFLDGKIASLRLYNRALTAAEVLQNYNATK
jgi:hypothetical protein